MKRVILLFFISFLFGMDNEYLEYSNKIINYNFRLNINKIRAPFEVKIINTKTKNNTIRTVLNKKVKINLLSILNNMVRVEIEEYIGDRLVKRYTKWIKKGERIGNCKLYYISFSKVFFKCKNKKIIKTLDMKILNIKEIRW